MILKNSNFFDAFLMEGLLSALWILVSAESMINTPRQRWCLKTMKITPMGKIIINFICICLKSHLQLAI